MIKNRLSLLHRVFIYANATNNIPLRISPLSKRSASAPTNIPLRAPKTPSSGRYTARQLSQNLIRTSAKLIRDPKLVPKHHVKFLDSRKDILPAQFRKRNSKAMEIGKQKTEELTTIPKQKIGEHKTLTFRTMAGAEICSKDLPYEMTVKEIKKMLLFKEVAECSSIPFEPGTNLGLIPQNFKDSSVNNEPLPDDLPVENVLDSEILVAASTTPESTYACKIQAEFQKVEHELSEKACVKS